MAGLYDIQAEAYAKKRPRYPKEWFSMLAALTADHSRAWDAGCGSGQAAISVAEHYDSVIATDVSQAQLSHAIPHPKVRYLHTPVGMSEDDLVAMLGGEGSLDLVTVAAAVHWFDIPQFYAVANRVLKKPGGVIAVWSYNYDIAPFGVQMKLVEAAEFPFADQRRRLAMDRYRELPFPFEPVGLGSEGKPVDLDMEVERSLDDFLGSFRTSSAVTTAKEKGADFEALLQSVVKEIRDAWGEPTATRKIVYKAFMLAGKPKC